METEIINATYPNGEYPIYIGQDLLNNSELLQRHIASKQVMIVTNETIAPLYLSTVQKIFTNYQCDQIILPDGEQYKTLEQLSHIWDQLAEKKHHRDTTLIALGGGVIGDMTGFAAACYQRGVAFIQIPTTLLSQVDASIGGKTAINHPLSKNLIGAFYQPCAVIIDTKTLATLPEREFNAGIAEIIKGALIKDKVFFDGLEKNLSRLLAREIDVLVNAIKQAIIIKCDIVAEDEKEQGIRALLNFGHTFAHAIEQNLGYGEWLHGEAVATGMILAADLSEEMGWLDNQEVKRINTMIDQIPLPKRLPSKLKCGKLVAAMQSDKKVLNEKIRLVLLKRIGEAVVTDKVTKQQLTEFLEQKLNTERDK